MNDNNTKQRGFANVSTVLSYPETKELLAIFQCLPTDDRIKILNLAMRLYKERLQQKWLESLGGAKNDSGAG